MTSTYNEDEVRELFDVVFKLSAKDVNDKLIKVKNRPEIAKRRWFWELLQNAKDAVKPDEQVSVILKLTKDEKNNPLIEFLHNGNPFRYQDAKNLVFPYSDKEEEPGSDKSGRFGTGFLATHILSPVINVSGVYIKDDVHFDFYFTLDRSGADKIKLAEAIDQTWQKFRANRKEKKNYLYTQESFDTRFAYPLNEDTLAIARESIADFQTALPFALAFIPKIRQVEIVNELDNEKIVYSKNNKKTVTVAEGITRYVIDKQVMVNGKTVPAPIDLAICTGEDVSVGVALEVKSGQTHIKNLPEHHPVVFCPFPLIGANDFPFPVTINSEAFTPKEERDGLWLGNTEQGKTNQALFTIGLKLYLRLALYASTGNWKGTHLLLKTLRDVPAIADLDIKWFTDHVQKPIKEAIVKIPLVDNAVNGRVAMQADHGKMYFPSHAKKEVREDLWELLNIIAPGRVPQKEEVHDWYDILWDEDYRTTFNKLAKFISEKADLKTLSEQLFLGDTSNATHWLDTIVTIISKEEPAILNEKGITILPNQLGLFKRKDDLYLDDGSMDDEIKEILALIGKFRKGVGDWRTELLEKKIFLELPENKTRSIKEISLLIVEHMRDLLRDDAPSKELQDLFSRLWNWLTENPDIKKNHFKALKTDTLLYKTANETQHKQLSELLRKEREGQLSVSVLVDLDPRKVALLSDPEFERKLQLGERVLADQLKEHTEFEFKRRTGSIFESVFRRIINADEKLDIRKVEGEEDFIVTNKSSNEEFYIELKSINNDEEHVQMTHKQAKKAHAYPENYILCIIPNDGSKIDEAYFEKHATFDWSIGLKLHDKVSKALLFEEPGEGIAVEFEDDLLKQYSKYRYKFIISKDICDTQRIEEFKAQLYSTPASNHQSKVKTKR